MKAEFTIDREYIDDNDQVIRCTLERWTVQNRRGQWAVCWTRTDPDGRQVYCSRNTHKPVLSGMLKGQDMVDAVSDIVSRPLSLAERELLLGPGGVAVYTSAFGRD